MSLPKWATTVTPLSKTLALILFITLPIIAFYLGFTVRNSATYQIDTIPTPPEIKYVDFVSKQELKPKTKQEILWRTFNFTTVNKKVAFSIKFPDTGNYCEGCFDGWPYNNAPNNVYGEWITGSYFQNDLDRKWSLTIGVLFQNITKDTKTAVGEYDPNIPTMVAAMQNLKSGERGTSPDRYGKTITITRQPDKQYGGSVWNYYISSDSEQKYYALNQQGENTIIISYSFNDPVYNVFDDILQSFSTTLIQNPDQGEPASSFNSRSAFDF